MVSKMNFVIYNQDNRNSAQDTQRVKELIEAVKADETFFFIESEPSEDKKKDKENRKRNNLFLELIHLITKTSCQNIMLDCTIEDAPISEQLNALQEYLVGNRKEIDENVNFYFCMANHGPRNCYDVIFNVETYEAYNRQKKIKIVFGSLEDIKRTNDLLCYISEEETNND